MITLCTCCGHQLTLETRFIEGQWQRRWTCGAAFRKERETAIAEAVEDVFAGRDWIRRLRAIKALGPEGMTALAEACGVTARAPTDWEAEAQTPLV